MISTVLFDLDGVIRHFDQDSAARIERHHGIESGRIVRIAFAGALLERLTTGRLTRADWITDIGDELGDLDAAIEWGAQPVHLDPDVLALASELSAAGVRTAILTNGTDTIPAESAALGLVSYFDPIFNTAEIGFAKPDPRAFAHVLDALGCEPGNVLFTDDSVTNIAAAAALGIQAHHFESASVLRQALRERGVNIGL